MSKTFLIFIVICALALPLATTADSYTYGNYSVGRWMELEFDQKYSLVFQMRRAINLGMQWGHRRAAKKGVLLTVKDESISAGCLLHASTGTIMDRIEALTKDNPESKEWGLFQAIAVVTLMECEAYGDPIREFDLN